MSVSVIIPCYNNAEYIAQAIESALRQSFSDVEVIVVNDGSTDSSGDIISSYAGSITYIEQFNQGACAARNAGLACASGDWIKFLDGDDWLYVDCLEKQLSSPGSSKEVRVGYGEIVDRRGEVLYEPHHIDSATFSSGASLSLGDFLNYPVLVATTLYPTDVIRGSGGFDPSIRRGQEHELHLRLFLSGTDFRFSPVKCFAYRQHQSASRISISRRNESYFSEPQRFKRLVNSARTGVRALTFEADRLHLARAAWRIGRRLVREGGDVKSAREFFFLAVSVGGSPAPYGNRVYRLLVRIFGPVRVERAILKARILLNYARVGGGG